MEIFKSNKARITHKKKEIGYFLRLFFCVSPLSLVASLQLFTNNKIENSIELEWQWVKGDGDGDDEMQIHAECTHTHILG